MAPSTIPVGQPTVVGVVQFRERAEAMGAFQEADFEILFDPRLDRREGDERAAHLALANLRFEEWFGRFRVRIPVHPDVSVA